MNKINPYPVTCSVDELKNNSNNIFHKAHFKKNIDNENLKVNDISREKKGNDIIECKICGRTYTRYNKSKHTKTKHHIFCEKINDKWRKTIINI